MSNPKYMMLLFEVLGPKLTPDDLAMFEDHMRSSYELDTFNLTLSRYGDIELHNIIVNKRKQGTGTQVMNELCKFADYYGVRILLSPDTKNRDTGTTSRNRLVNFYKRFGFVENKGRNKDFRISYSMKRSPRIMANKGDIVNIGLHEDDDDEFNAEYDEPNYDHIPSVSAITPQMKVEMAEAAQKVYDRWEQGENDELNGGGICHLIADEVAYILSRANITVATQCSSYEQHVYCIAQFREGIYEIDIPYSSYERGGGFTWTKLPDVQFDSSFIVVSRLDSDPGNMNQYVEDWEE